ncbi:unnamed protein product, partial [Sphenostylis stenocarpa]
AAQANTRAVTIVNDTSRVVVANQNDPTTFTQYKSGLNPRPQGPVSSPFFALDLPWLTSASFSVGVQISDLSV